MEDYRRTVSDPKLCVDTGFTRLKRRREGRASHSRYLLGDIMPRTKPIGKWSVIYDPPPGTMIEDACYEALQEAKKRQSTVSFMFNGTRINANPTGTISGLTEEYWKRR